MNLGESKVYRRAILEILHAAALRRRGPEDDASTYTVEPLIQSLLRTRGLPMPIETMRHYLYYLLDRQYVKMRHLEHDIGYLTWRITADGEDILDGTRTDPGIARG